MYPIFVLMGGGILSALVGLIGIWMTNRENTPIEGVLSPDELESYRNKRLVGEGLSWCSMGKHYYQAAPGQHERGACVDCLPPIVENVIERTVSQAQEGQRQPWNRRTYAAPGRNAYVPIHLRPGWENYGDED